MGRFAQVLSIGVKGTIEVVVPKREYYAGEWIVGHVKLCIHDSIDAEGFTLTLAGKEHLSWHVRQGKTTAHHHVRHEVFRQQIPLVSHETTFPAGDYIFPFQFQMPFGLPGTFSMYKPNVEYTTRVMSTLLYKLMAEVNVKGTLTADIGCEYKIAVHALPVLPPQPPQSIEDNLTRPVYFLCCFNQGTNTISGSTSVNYVDLVKGMVRIHGTVRNNTTRAIAAVYVRLYQEFIVHIPQGFNHGGQRFACSRLLHQVQIDGVAPGAHKDDILTDLSIPHVVANVTQSGKQNDRFNGDTDMLQIQPFAQPPMHPTVDLMFVSISYHIEIFCSIPWCSDVKLEFPLGIHQPPFIPMPQAAKVPS